MLMITQAESPQQIAAARELMREFTTWAVALTPGSEQAPTFEGLETELATLPGIYAPPSGRLLLATQEDRPAGCVCLKQVDATTGELKRFYVRPDFRGQHIGWALVNRLIDEARATGYRRIILDSHIALEKAQAIYEGVGFKRVPAPDSFPDAFKPIVVFMELELV